MLRVVGGPSVQPTRVHARTVIWYPVYTCQKYKSHTVTSHERQSFIPWLVMVSKRLKLNVALGKCTGAEFLSLLKI